MELENDQETTDPYLEGGESTWFTIMPSSDVHSIGERVSEGDQIRLVGYFPATQLVRSANILVSQVSTRWQWEVSLPEAEDEEEKPAEETKAVRTL